MSMARDGFVDAAFPLVGTSLPLDHGYALFSALSRIEPALHTRSTWGVHPVRGTRSGPGVLQLDRRSLLKIRMPTIDVGALLPLAGASLTVDGHDVRLGVIRLYPLEPSARLRARFVTVKGFAEDPSAFRAALARQVAHTADLGQDPERVEIAVGPRRVMRVAQHTIVGYPVELTGLEADASLAVQRVGLGGRRHMGAGIFVPPRGRG